LLYVNVCSANFGEFDFEQCGVRLELRLGNFTYFEWGVGLGDYGNEWHVERIEHP